jgi:hypothetical protein
MSHPPIVAVAALMLVLATATWAQGQAVKPAADEPAPVEEARDSLPPGENLIAPPPQGWQLAFSDRDDDRAVYDYVPPGQDAEEWREMMTVQVLFDARGAPPRALLDRLRREFEQGCEGAQAEAAVDRPVTSYPGARQLFLCGRSKRGGKGEAALVQVVVGREAAYALHRAWRGDAFRGTQLPAEARALIAGWQRQLDAAGLCDTRTPERACRR